MYSNITKIYLPNVHLKLLMILCRNVYIIMLIYAEEKGLYVLEIKNCGIVSLGHLVGPHGYLSYNEFKAKIPNVRTDFLLYEGILTAVKCYQRRLGFMIIIIIDRFYIALVSALEQTHCARMLFYMSE